MAGRRAVGREFQPEGEAVTAPALSLVPPLWQSALRARAMKKSWCSSARVELVDLLERAGVTISLVTVHTWTRQQQADAYLWAIRTLKHGYTPAPRHVQDGRDP